MTFLPFITEIFVTNKSNIIHLSICVTNRRYSKISYPHIYFVELWVGVFVKYRIASRGEAAKPASRALDLARSPEN